MRGLGWGAEEAEKKQKPVRTYCRKHTDNAAPRGPKHGPQQLPGPYHALTKAHLQWWAKTIAATFERKKKSATPAAKLVDNTAGFSADGSPSPDEEDKCDADGVGVCPPDEDGVGVFEQRGRGEVPDEDGVFEQRGRGEVWSSMDVVVSEDVGVPGSENNKFQGAVVDAGVLGSEDVGVPGSEDSGFQGAVVDVGVPRSEDVGVLGSEDSGFQGAVVDVGVLGSEDVGVQGKKNPPKSATPAAKPDATAGFSGDGAPSSDERDEADASEQHGVLPSMDVDGYEDHFDGRPAAGDEPEPVFRGEGEKRDEPVFLGEGEKRDEPVFLGEEEIFLEGAGNEADEDKPDEPVFLGEGEKRGRCAGNSHVLPQKRTVLDKRDEDCSLLGKNEAFEQPFAGADLAFPPDRSHAHARRPVPAKDCSNNKSALSSCESFAKDSSNNKSPPCCPTKTTRCSPDVAPAKDYYSPSEEFSACDDGEKTETKLGEKTDTLAGSPSEGASSSKEVPEQDGGCEQLRRKKFSSNADGTPAGGDERDHGEPVLFLGDTKQAFGRSAGNGQIREATAPSARPGSNGQRAASFNEPAGSSESDPPSSDEDNCAVSLAARWNPATSVGLVDPELQVGVSHFCLEKSLPLLLLATRISSRNSNVRRKRIFSFLR